MLIGYHLINVRFIAKTDRTYSNEIYESSLCILSIYIVPVTSKVGHSHDPFGRPPQSCCTFYCYCFCRHI